MTQVSIPFSRFPVNRYNGKNITKYLALLMTLPFLAAKTRFPIPTSNLVARHRLLASLDAGLRPGVQVMLVAAPAGAGKTCLGWHTLLQV